jgi:hypothetical protein
MTRRSQRLQELKISSPCKTSWDAMQGEGNHHFCGECQRDVFDLAHMLPSEIERHLRATQGVMCARLTRRNGQLIMAREELPAGSVRSHGWGFPGFAAGVVSAAVSAGVALAQAAPPPATAPALPSGDTAGPAEAGHVHQAAASTPGRAALRGAVQSADGPLPGVVVTAHNTFDDSERTTRTRPDGSFVFESVAPGVYWVEGALDGWEIDLGSAVLSGTDSQTVSLQANRRDESETVGILAVAGSTTRQLFEQSEHVVVATIGPSVALRRSEGLVNVGTTLRVTTSIKGQSVGADLVYEHEESAWDADAAWRSRYVPGTEVAAFLERHDSHEIHGPTDARVTWQGTRFSELRILLPGEAKMFVDRYAALGRLATAAQKGGLDGAQAVEWLVATAENPRLSTDSSGELFTNRRALDRFAEDRNIPVSQATADLLAMAREFRADGGKLGWSPDEALLGALLTGEQTARLKAAFFRTESLAKVDYMLMKFVRETDADRVDRWLLRELPKDQRQPDEEEEVEFERAVGICDLLDDDTALQAIVLQARSDRIDIGTIAGNDRPEVKAAKRRQIDDLARKMRKDMATALAARLQAAS